jgi:hypothetical protein
MQRIGHRFNRTEVVTALRVGEKTAVALEVPIVTGGLTSGSVDVRTSGVSLPDLNERVADWLPRRRQNAAGQQRDRPDGRRDGVVEDQQVVVCIEGQLVRIERAFCGCRGFQELLREGAGC